MKLRLFLLLLFTVVISVSLKAQNVNTGSISNHLIATGRVNLMQDERLTQLLGPQPKTYYANPAQQEKGNKLKTRGYRIRVFSGNQQNTSKNRAYKIQSDIQLQMPELSTYVTFKTPNWRLLVGDYRTSEEANSMLRILRKEFPGLSKDMFVVNDEIEL